MQTKRFENNALQLDQLVVAPERDVSLTCPRDAMICIPFFEGLLVDGKASPKLFPSLTATEPGIAKNVSGTVGLTTLFSVWNNVTVLAFGSRIHGNAQQQSDLDLMILSNEIPGREYSYGKVSIQFETPQIMMQRALDGDLFIKSLGDSALAVFDPNDWLTKLKHTFTPRRSYQRTLKGCADIAFILMHPEIAQLSPAFAARKIIWALRTSSMAEGHDPFIHPESVKPEDRQVIDAAKASKEAGNMEHAYPQVQSFFGRRGFTDPMPKSATLADCRRFFETESNPVGIRMCYDLLQFAAKNHSHRTK